MPLIRLAAAADAPAVQTIYAPYVRETAISFEYDPPTVDEMRARITATCERYPYLVLEEGGDILGYAYASSLRGRRAYDWSVETTIYLRNDARNRGIGRALYESLIPTLTLLGYRQAYAGIALPNAASVALHERVGFTHLGTYERVGWKFDRWHSVGWWQLLLEGPEDEPIPPASISEVAGSDRLLAVLSGGLSYLRP